MNKIRSKTKRKKQVQAPCTGVAFRLPAEIAAGRPVGGDFRRQTKCVTCRRPSIDLVILFLTIAADHFKSRSKDYGEGMEGT